MAKIVIRCGDVRVDCDYEAQGETVSEVLLNCWEHAQREHGLKALPEELAAKVRAGVRED